MWITVANDRGNSAIPAVNDLQLAFNLDSVGKKYLSLAGEDGVGIDQGAPISVPPGVAKRVQLTLSGKEAIDTDTYCSLHIESNDPDSRDAEVRLGLTSQSPRLELYSGTALVEPTEPAVRFVVPTSAAGTDEVFSASFRIQNGGGGYLDIAALVTQGNHASWVEVPVPPPPLRRGEHAVVEVRLRAKYLPSDTYETNIPILVRLVNGDEVPYRISVQVRPPAQLDVKLPQFRRDLGGTFVLDCLPYGRRDFEMQVSNVGGDPLAIVEIGWDHTEQVRIYRAGDVRVEPGGLESPFPLQPGESSSTFKLSVDLMHFDFPGTQLISLTFVTDPATAGVVIRMQLRIEARPFKPELGTYIGIDFGTTSSTVTIMDLSAGGEDQESFVVLPIEEESIYAGRDDLGNLHSALYFRDVDDPVIGATADSIGTGKADRFLRSFKRTIGLHCPRYILGRMFTPQDLAEIIFSRLIERAMRSLPAFTPLVVATCPANFADYQRRSTLRACRRALMKKMLHVHADSLLERIAPFCTGALDLTDYLATDKAAQRLLRLAADTAHRDQPRVTWDVEKPWHALLLLAYVSMYRHKFFDLNEFGGIEEGSDKLDASDLSGGLLLQIFGMLEQQGRAKFTPSPGTTLAMSAGRPLSELLDFVEDWVSDALQTWSLMDVQLLEEPTAAAWAYVLRNMTAIEQMNDGERRYIAVYDFGGGTFDISVVSITKSDTIEVEVIQSDGINEMGGDDLDFALIQHYLDKGKPEPKYRRLLESSIYSLSMLYSTITTSEREQRNLDNAVKNVKRRLKKVAEADKISFSVQPDLPKKITDLEGQNPIEFAGGRTVNVTRAEFDALMRTSVSKTIDKFKDVIRRARYREEQRGREFRLDRVVLAGKTSRLPLIRQMILSDPDLGIGEDRFDTSLRNDEKNCVARGAAYYGYVRGNLGDHGRVEARARTIAHAIGLITGRGSWLQEFFETIPGLEKGAALNGGALRGRHELPWRLTGREFIAQNAGTDNRVLRNPDVTRVGVYRWGGFVADVSPEARVVIHVSVDGNGLISVSGELRGMPFGSYQPIPPSLQDKPVFVFI